MVIPLVSKKMRSTSATSFGSSNFMPVLLVTSIIPIRSLVLVLCTMNGDMIFRFLLMVPALDRILISSF